MMKQMMEMSKLNENHKLLSSLDGNWNYTIKMWMNPDPNAEPQESKGTATLSNCRLPCCSDGRVGCDPHANPV